jgi:PAS domain S-box-containing protein
VFCARAKKSPREAKGVDVLDKDDAFFYAGQTIVTLIESLSDGILIADKDSVVRYVNESYLNIVGIKREAIMGKFLPDVRPGSVLPQVIKTGQSRLGIIRREISTNYVVDLNPLCADGEIIGGVSLIKDIDRIKQLSKELEQYVRRNEELKKTVTRLSQAKYTFDDVIGASALLHNTIAMAKRMADYDEDILILGDSGTGKELFAQAIHNYSARSSKPFVALNCSTLNASLIESELFGYVDGSFTGAAKGGKLGLFAVADTGTILLDEIAELPINMQAKLLRVLQERKIRKVGDFNEEDVNIRVIAATNKDLFTIAKQGGFREDLYYRLSAMTLEIPNLRERREDIAPLAEYFLAIWCKKHGRQLGIQPYAYEMMENYSWPGNVRELKNVLWFSAYACNSNMISELHLPKSQMGGRLSKNIEKDIIDMTNNAKNLKTFLAETEKSLIKAMLLRYGTTLSAKKTIAAKLQISLATFYNKLKQINIDEQ